MQILNLVKGKVFRLIIIGIILLVWFAVFFIVFRLEKFDLSRASGCREPANEEEEKYTGYGYGAAWAGSEYNQDENIGLMERLNRIKVGVTFFFRSVIWRRSIIIGTIIAVILGIISSFVKNSILLTLISFLVVSLVIYHATSYYFAHECLPASSHVLKHVDHLSRELFIPKILEEEEEEVEVDEEVEEEDEVEEET